MIAVTASYTLEAVDLFGYLDYRAFLDDWFQAQKDRNPRYSHRLFARRAGVRSPSLLKEVIAGRRNLTPRTTEGFIRALGLNTEEAAFFTDLVLLDQASSPEVRTEALERVAASRRFREARPIEGAMVEYLSRWYTPAIRELAHRGDLTDDPEAVARRLRPRITTAQARDAIGTLLDLGMLVRDGDVLRPAEVTVKTPHEVAGLVAHAYHRQMLDRARDSIEGADPSERHLLGVTVGIPEALVPQLKAELDAFQERLLHLCDQHAAETERVYQLHLHLFPLSERDP